MTELLEAVKTWLTEDEWPVMQPEGTTILRTAYSGKNGSFNCSAQIRENQFLLLFYSVCPVHIPEDRRPAVAEYITRANYGLSIGNFEMDYTDGEVRYKSSIDVENTELTPALIHNVVYASVWMMDRYLPGIMQVIYANTDPSEAIKKIEG
jgi:hypothetical protein